MADTYEALGLLPHDLARDLLDADLRWGEAAGYGELHRRVRAHRVPWAQKSRGIEQQRACTDMLFLYRTNPVISSFGDWASLGQAYSDVLSPGDPEADPGHGRTPRGARVGCPRRSTEWTANPTRSGSSVVRVGPVVEGPRPLQVRLINAYMPRLPEVAARDAAVTNVFMRVAGMVDPLPSLLRPTVALRALSGSLRRPALPPPPH
ncbi:MAG: hypothetical protein M3276_11245 [Actinomycetota bacterium]|nr:hypothetical protein [Actinomycetota bacterium]